MMKLILAFSYKCLLTAMFAAALPPEESRPFVLDTNGQPLRSSGITPYFIEPQVTGNLNKGVTLINRNKDCPSFVALDGNPKAQGTTVTITSLYTKNLTHVRENIAISVDFVGNPCRTNTAWSVGGEEPMSKSRFIVTGGYSDYFTVEKFGVDAYKLGLCYRCASAECREKGCGYIGISNVNGKWHLSWGKSPIPFKFRKV